MIIYKRFALLLGVFLLTIAFLLLRSGDSIRSSRIWKEMPQKVGLGEWVTDEEDEYKPELEALQQTTSRPTSIHDAYEDNDFTNSMYGPSKFKPGVAKAPGSKYTKAVVMGRVLSENTTWLEETNLPPEVQTYIYGIDDSSSPLRTPQNKGREAMVYLTYIIEHYDTLPDVMIFLHAHQMAWHNNELLNHDATEMIQRLSSERVTREGYMNLRCSWIPGCPTWINPGAVLPDRERPEEGVMAEAWAHLFPGDRIPSMIGSACCAQFAVSRDRIRNIPLTRFERYRNWLLHTRLPDQISGRVFEYLWGKIFMDEATFCPDQRVCYCDGYGVCFEDETVFDYWFELQYKQRELRKRLVQWRDQAARLTRERQGWGSLELMRVKIPPVDEDVRLRAEIDELGQEMEAMRLEALQKGVDPQVRARIAGRPWKDGDGY